MRGLVPVRDEGRGYVLVDVETQLHMQTGVSGIEDAVVFLLRAFRIVAQLLHLISRFRPGAVKSTRFSANIGLLLRKIRISSLPLRPPMIKLMSR